MLQHTVNVGGVDNTAALHKIQVKSITVHVRFILLYISQHLMDTLLQGKHAHNKLKKNKKGKMYGANAGGMLL